MQEFKVGEEIVLIKPRLSKRESVPVWSNPDFESVITEVDAIRNYSDGSTGIWIKGYALCFNPDGSICSALQASHSGFKIIHLAE